VKRLEKALCALRKEVDNNFDVIGEILPAGVGEYLGESLTSAAFTSATGKRKVPEPRSPKSKSRILALFLAYELHYQHGPVLLRAVLKGVHDPIRDLVELQRRNKGGHPPNFIRNRVLDRLIESSNAIIGKRATSTAGGRFVELCDVVLRALDQETTGLEKAIAARLRRRKRNVVLRALALEKHIAAYRQILNVDH
jgi:hypothetical protein